MMKPKVLMFGWEFPPHNSGGLGTACLGICKAMVKQGVDLVFVLPRRIDNLDACYKIEFAGLENVVWERINSSIYPYLTAEKYKTDQLKENNGFYGPTLFEEVKEYSYRAETIAQKHHYDIIHAHDWLSFPAGLKAKQTSQKPLVVHVHATEFDRTGGHRVNEQVYAIEKEGMDKADGIVAISHWTKDMIMKHYGIKKDKIRVVHNGIDSTKFRPQPKVLEQLKKKGNKIILFVGRITLQKGPDYFIEMAKKVLTLRDNVYFVMVGSGDMEQAMIRKVAESKISDRVIFTGFLRDQDLNRMYQSADLFVLPSVSEPFGLTPLESLVNGTPVLISKQSGVSEVVSHALKVDFWDTEEMTNKIVALIDHPPLYADLKVAGQLEVQRLTWDKAVLSYLDFYKTILGRRQLV